MIKNRLLSHIYFGSELNKLDAGTLLTKNALKKISSEFAELNDLEWDNIKKIVIGFFKERVKGQFGGPITAGDAYFIAAYMAAIKPKIMIEIGVCSGVSSAFILYAGHKLGLMREGCVFLHSFDLMRLHGPDELEVGRVVRMNYPSLLDFWKLNVEVTAPQLALEQAQLKAEVQNDGPVLAFVDANHMHPWPLVDVMSLAKVIPSNSWLLLQDTQLMERWLANSVELGVPTPRPCRGVNLVETLWPGSKAIGWDICYNMGAIKLDISTEVMHRFADDALYYPGEVGPNEEALCRTHLSKLINSVDNR